MEDLPIKWIENEREGESDREIFLNIYYCLQCRRHFQSPLRLVYKRERERQREINEY